MAQVAPRKRIALPANHGGCIVREHLNRQRLAERSALGAGIQDVAAEGEDAGRHIGERVIATRHNHLARRIRRKRIYTLATQAMHKPIGSTSARHSALDHRQ